MLTITRRYDPHQLRDPDGTWGDGIPGPQDAFDMAGLHDIIEVEGTFGDLTLGVDDAGDVRVAFREAGQVRELDLDTEEIAGLADALAEVAAERDDLPDDADMHGIYYDAAFGAGGAHRVELYGSGVMTVTFGYGDDDPYELSLDPSDGEDDDVTVLTLALDEVLQGSDVDRAAIERKYDAGQRRDRDGQWADGNPGPLSDPLRLAETIQLNPGEAYLGSARVDADQGGIRMALTDRAGRRMLRLGAGGEGYGRRNPETGTVGWDGNPSRERLSEADRERLDAEHDALADEYDTATPARQEEIDRRQEEINDRLATDDQGFNGTANLDEYSWRRLADQIRPALAEALEQEKAENDAWDEIQDLELDGNPDPERMARLREVARLGATDGITFTSGIVAGSEWGDVHYSVELHDPSVGVEVLIGVTPKGATDDWGDTLDWKGQFTAAEARKFLRLLDKLNADAARARSPENGDKAAPAGGQFAVGGGRVGGKGKKPTTRRGPRRPAAPSGPLSFNGKTGTGYGIRGGDQRVRGLQQQLTRLGVTDSDGKPLAPDGKYGPKTTSAVKKLQRALGLEPDGKVTPELLKQVTELKQLPPRKPSTPRKRRIATSARARLLLAQINRALNMGGEMRQPQLYDRAFPLADIQISRSGDGRTVTAYAAMFGTPYEVRDQHGHYMEVIDRSAFNRTLAGGAGQSAMCLYNHGMSVVDGRPDPMAQIPIGTPLKIEPDGKGLLTVTRYNNSPYADEVLEAIRNGAIRSQSFRGRIVRSSPDRVPARARGGDLPTITRHELGLTDYGPTPIPVNVGAAILAIRSKADLLHDFAALDDDDRLELLRSLGVPLDGDGDDEAPHDDAPDEGDDTPTSEVELGAEDPPPAQAERHSGRQHLKRLALEVARTIAEGRG